MKRISYIFLVITMLMFSMTTKAQQRHEVKSGETLYSLSRTYGVTVKQIIAANPGMNENIMAGQIIQIPVTKSVSLNQLTQSATRPLEAAVNISSKSEQSKPTVPCKTTYKVKKKETLYGIAHDNGISVQALIEANPTLTNDDKLKKGTELCIPYTKEELLALYPPAPAPVIEIKKPEPVSLAVIMPYGLDHEKKNKDMITMIDFYEGVMLAISDLKKEGVSAKIYAYDEADIDSVLRLPQIKNVKLIIGPKNVNNITKLISFTEQNNISLVVPLSSNSAIVNNTRNVYQVNTKLDTNGYLRAYESLIEMHPNAKFVFVNIEDQMDKLDNTTRLKNFLNGQNKLFANVDLKNIGSIRDVLSEEGENIIVLSSGTKTAYTRVVKRLNELDLSSYNIQMCGYADWQAFADKEAESFRKYRCIYFTTFYNNPNSTASITFNQKFRHSFKRDQYNTYPRYGMLGYDIANYFVRHMFEQGDNFASNIDNLRTPALQNPMHFVHKNSWSGFVNNALMFVQYNADGTISVRQY